MTEQRLLEFAAAWGSKDLKRLMDFFTHDCIYAASVGSEPGQTYTGIAQVRAGIVAMLEHDTGSTSKIHNIGILGERGFWEWTYTFKDGTVALGCDLFEFRGDKIRVKNAFRKVQP
jgi:SnoaL-like domain